MTYIYLFFNNFLYTINYFLDSCLSAEPLMSYCYIIASYWSKIYFISIYTFQSVQIGQITTFCNYTKSSGCLYFFRFWIDHSHFLFDYLSWYHRFNASYCWFYNWFGWHFQFLLWRERNADTNIKSEYWHWIFFFIAQNE